MAPRTLLSAVIACIAVASCSAVDQRMVLQKPTAGECKMAGNCKIAVAVVSGKITVDPEYLIVNNQRNSTIIVTWELPASSGYKLEKVEVPEGGTEIDGCHAEGPQRWQCNNKHTTFGVYKYKITVSGQPPVPVYDPWIVND
jgi:hypothetical protein